MTGKRTAGWIAGGGVIAALVAIALVRDTAANGHDFTVFWNAGRSLWEGRPLYSVARDGAMVFKYPPWIAPVFVPISWLPLVWAKWVWGVIEVLSLAAVLAWAHRRAAVRLCVLAGVTPAFWGLWAVHALDGQVVLPMLALSLWGWELGARLLIMWVLTAKIFSLAALPGVRWGGDLREGEREKSGEKAPARSLGAFAQTVMAAAGLFVALSVPALYSQPGHSPGQLFADWADAASSGYREFGAEHVFGRTNPGLPALVLRLAPTWMPVRGVDLALGVLALLVLGALWWRHQPRDSRAAWAGWLAIVPVVHPLPWWHLFIFAFPLALLCADRVLFARKRPTGEGSGIRRVMSAVGIFLIAMATEKFLGPIGVWAELASAKSWGVLLCLASIRD